MNVKSLIRNSKQPLRALDSSITKSAVDVNWYFRMYPDVKGDGLDAAEHYVKFGAKEGRWPNPFFDTRWYVNRYLHGDININPLAHFLKNSPDQSVSPNFATDLNFLSRKYKDFFSFPTVFDFLNHHYDNIDDLSEWFSRSFYLQSNPDVTEAGMPAEYHWITSGIREGRQPHPRYLVHKVTNEDPLSSKIITLIHSDGTKFILEPTGLPPDVERQITEQSRFEPDLFAVGTKCFTALPIFDADDLNTRDLIDFERLVTEFDQTDTAIIVPFLGVGGAEKYAANLADALQNDGRRVTVITTTSNRYSDFDAVQIPNLKSLRRCNVVSLAPYLERTWKKSNILALLLLSLQVKDIFVINSDLGLECLQSYGRALSSSARLFTCFFSQAPIELGVTFPARYLHRLLPFVTVISDNQAALDLYDDASGHLYAQKLVCLPQSLSLTSQVEWDAIVQQRLIRRAKRQIKKRQRIRAVWASRWEPYKATDILLHLLQTHQDIDIDVFGVNKTQLHPIPNLPSSLHCRGEFTDVREIPVHQYDVFIFTSYFEGMPNVVLEMANYGVPIIASDVGGIRETFANGQIELVDMSLPHDSILEAFYVALIRVFNEPEKDLANRLRATRDALLTKHSKSAFMSQLKTLVSS